MMSKLPLITIAIGITLTAFAPYIFTHFSSCIYFGKPNEIGDTIGGITSPIIGIMGAILVYLTFEQQNRAIQQPIDTEQNRLNVSKELILLDLKDNVLSDLILFLSNAKVFKGDVMSNNKNVILSNNKYTGLTMDIYNSIGIERLYLSFGKDVFELSHIYRRIDYLNSIDLFELYKEVDTSISLGIDNSLFFIKREAFGRNMDSIILTLEDTIKKTEYIISKYQISKI